jgi:hypothetical protein
MPERLHHRAAVTDLYSTIDGTDVQANVRQVRHLMLVVRHRIVLQGSEQHFHVGAT